MSDYVGSVSVAFEETDEGMVGHVEVCPGTESDPEMLMTLAAAALVDYMNALDVQLRNSLPGNRAARRAAARRHRH